MKADDLGIIVLAVSLVAILTVAARHNLFHDIDDMVKSLKVGRHNIDYQIFPDRSRPLVIAGKEFSLREVYPNIFDNFTRGDWQEFWDIIYGAHPLIKFENEILENADRNYYTDEVQSVLVKRYPQSFSNFDLGTWRIFWKQIYGISPGVQALLEDEKQRERSDRRLDRSMQKDTEEISSTVKGVKEEIENR